MVALFYFIFLISVFFFQFSCETIFKTYKNEKWNIFINKFNSIIIVWKSIEWSCSHVEFCFDKCNSRHFVSFTRDRSRKLFLHKCLSTSMLFCYKIFILSSWTNNNNNNDNNYWNFNISQYCAINLINIYYISNYFSIK